jgi:hypothetical protein
LWTSAPSANRRHPESRDAIQSRPAPMRTSAETASLAAEAYNVVRQRIARGELVLGQPVSRRRLAAELGMSFLPVRGTPATRIRRTAGKPTACWDARTHPVAAGRRRQLHRPPSARDAGRYPLLTNGDARRTFRAPAPGRARRCIVDAIRSIDVPDIASETAPADRGICPMRRAARRDREDPRAGAYLVVCDAEAVTGRFAA